MQRLFAKSGFTLIELIIAIAVAAILLSAGVPSFLGAIERNRLKSVGEAIYADLQFIRSEAIERNRYMSIKFDVDGSDDTDWCYGLKLGILSGGASCDCRQTDASQADYCEIDGAKKVVSSADYKDTHMTGLPSNTLSFNPFMGTSNAGTVTLSRSNGEDLSIVLSSTGRVKICAPTGTGIPGYASC